MPFPLSASFCLYKPSDILSIQGQIRKTRETLAAEFFIASYFNHSLISSLPLEATWSSTCASNSDRSWQDRAAWLRTPQGPKTNSETQKEQVSKGTGFAHPF